MCSDRSHVVFFSFEDVSIAYAAFDLTCDTIAVSFRISCGVYEESFLNSLEVSAYFDDFFHEQNSSFLDVTSHLSQRTVFFQFNHFHQAVHADESLFRIVAGFHVVDMPRNVSSFVRCNGGLDICAGQLGNEHVHYVSYCCFSYGGADVLGVLLCSHLVSAAEVTQSNCIRQVHVHTRSRRCCWRYGGQSDVIRSDTNLFGEQGVDGMLNDQFRHYLPCFSCSCVGVVCTVDLQDSGPCQDLLGFAGIYEGTYAVDISVQNVVLRVLVRTVDTFFCKHYSYVRTSYAGNVGMIVDWTANFIFDDVQSLSLCSYLLTGHRNTADTLRSTFHQAIDVGLTHVTDNHDMVSAMPCSHSHSADIVFETSGSDFGGDHRHRLRVDVFEVFGRRQAYAVLQRLGNVMVFERAHVLVFSRLSPGPASSSRLVLVDIL